MKEIIPIKKEFLLKTTVAQITNIDLNHEFSINDKLVIGNILLNGSYKMTEASVLEDDFSYKIPFKVSISKEVNKDTIKIDIDDFKYNVNKDVLSVEVDLLFSCEEIKEHYEIESPINQEVIEETKEEDNISNDSEININENINNITNIINNDNKYYTYKIYVAKEGDSIDSIALKYNVSINELSLYNDIKEIHEGDKIIIPYINE